MIQKDTKQSGQVADNSPLNLVIDTSKTGRFAWLIPKIECATHKEIEKAYFLAHTQGKLHRRAKQMQVTITLQIDDQLGLKRLEELLQALKRQPYIKATSQTKTIDAVRSILEECANETRTDDFDPR